MLPSSQESTPVPQLAEPRVPFVIGVTGNMDPVGYHDDRAICDKSPEMKKLRETITAIIDWVRSGKGSLDPARGTFLVDSKSADDEAHWNALGLVNSPIMILSSLAPGIDTLVVETALDYAAKHPKAGITILAPLPFPADIYIDATTFNTPAKKQRFRELRARLNESNLFEVALDNDLLRGTPDEAREDLTATDPDFGNKSRRHLRYRAAGEYVAAHSDLLLAVFDEKLDTPKLDDIFEAGTATIVEAKRRGLTHELLAVANNFAWADNGPVLLIPAYRQKRKDLSSFPPPGDMRLIHPYDLRPEKDSDAKDDDKDWQKSGDIRFRRVLMRQDKFNGLKENDREKGELKSMTKSLTDKAAIDFAAALDPIACIRRRAADAAIELSKFRTRLLFAMFALIFFAANFLGAYEHWHHKDSHPHPPHPGQWVPEDFMTRTQGGLLSGAFLCLIVCGFAYYLYLRSDREANRFDYRSIGEALRVQFYWKLAGTGRSVASDYMQRQRDELDWIRYVVSSLSMPHETTRKDFLKLPKDNQVALFETTRADWIVKQIGYYVNNTKKREDAAHFWHGTGWTLVAAGLISLLVMLAATLILPYGEHLHEHVSETVKWLFAIGVPLLIFHFVKAWWGKRKKRAAGTHHSDHSHDEGVVKASRRTGFLSWVFGKPLTWGIALVLAAIVIGLCHSLETSHGHDTTHHHVEVKETKYLPDAHNSWIILTGALLLGGAMSVAWAERNFYGEEARQFRAMGHLFSCANRRLKELIGRYKKAPETGTTTDRILFEIHDILHQLGCEALDENAEWLIQHRSRPLEMPMAG